MSQPVLWTYPDNDLWCEFLNFEDGDCFGWDVWKSSGICALEPDYYNYEMGALSIKGRFGATTNQTFNYLRLTFTKLSRVKDFSIADFLEFNIKLGRIGGSGGITKLVVTLWSVEPMPVFPNQYFKAQKGIPIDDAFLDWQKITLPVGPKNEAKWIVEPGFDWTKIWRIEFSTEQNAGGPVWADVWIDGMIYGAYATKAIVIVNSSPYQGVDAVIDLFPGQQKTPTAWIIEPPTSCIVTVSSRHPQNENWVFDHWDDKSETISRYIASSSPGIYEVTAFYKETTTPPPPWRIGYYLKLFMENIQKFMESIKR